MGNTIKTINNMTEEEKAKKATQSRVWAAVTNRPLKKGLATILEEKSDSFSSKDKKAQDCFPCSIL